MKTFEFIYIATGDHYILYFEGFIKSLENFCKDTVYKKVKFLTDQPDYDIQQFKDLKNIEIESFYINHYPWPIITLFKMHYMNNFIDDDYDLLFYCNANYRFKETNDIPKVFLKKDKIFFSMVHKTKGTEFEYWYKFNIFNKNLPYILGTMFGGPKIQIKKCLEYVIKHINDGLIKNKIPIKHDELMLNKYLFEINKNGENNYTIFYLDDIGYLDNDVKEYKGIKYQHINGDFIGNNSYFDLYNYPQCKPLQLNRIICG